MQSTRLINARVAGAAAFRRGYAARRCLIRANGWYEWRAGDSPRKHAHDMTPSGGTGLAFAGLYELRGRTGELLTIGTIRTAPALGLIGPVPPPVGPQVLL